MILFCAWQLVIAGLYRQHVSAPFLFEKHLTFYYGETCSILRTSALYLGVLQPCRGYLESFIPCASQLLPAHKDRLSAAVSAGR